MPAASSSSSSVQSSRLKPAGFDIEIREQRSQSPGHLPATQPGLVRHYTSLQEHADAVHRASTTPDGSEWTPWAEERREGFTWEVNQDVDAQASPSTVLPMPPTPRTPPSMEEIMRTTAQERGTRGTYPSLLSTDSFPIQGPSRQTSASSAKNYPSRTDSHRSSISVMARGVMRHMPFARSERQPEDEKEVMAIMGRRDSTTGRQLKFELPKSPPNEKEAKVPESKPPPAKLAPSNKGTLKDRRKVALGEAMKITLPPIMPDLPSRSRTPMADLNNVIAPRPRSPKTPWIHDQPPAWQSSSFASAPAAILEDADEPLGLLPGNDIIVSSQAPQPDKADRARLHRPLLRLGRGKSSPTLDSDALGSFAGNVPVSHQATQPSRPPIAHNVDQPHPHTQADLKEMSDRPRPRRHRWSGRWGSTGTAETPDRPSPSHTSFSLSRILKPIRSTSSQNHASKLSHQQTADALKLANMPLPPDFVPPGTQRVPTPPSLDANGEVKGKLADFFFDIEGTLPSSTHTRQNMPNTPGGIWDSDAILMSQVTDISPPSSGSEESPQGLTPSPQPRDDNTTPFFNLVLSHPSPDPAGVDADGNETWFRKSMPADPLRRDSSGSMLRAQEAMAKLEWLIPEHLPWSPLCPLHAKYVGPSAGVCVFHGRREAGDAAAGGMKRVQRTGSAKRGSGGMDGEEEDKADEVGWRHIWNLGFVRSRRSARASSSGCSPMGGG